MDFIPNSEIYDRLQKQADKLRKKIGAKAVFITVLDGDDEGFSVASGSTDTDSTVLASRVIRDANRIAYDKPETDVTINE